MSKKKQALPVEHHIQFSLVDPNFEPISEPRKYQISWINTGDKAGSEQLQSGSTDNKGMTSLIKTKGKVPVTLSIAPPDGSDCKTVGTTSSKELDKKPVVRIQLKVTAEIISAPKSLNQCATLEVREGKQQIQFIIKNVTKSGNSLKDLPYLIVDADKMEALSDSAITNDKTKKFKGTSAQVQTEIVNCDGIKNVGIVLGNATDDIKRWKDKSKNLVLFLTEPKENGITTVVITEFATPGDPATRDNPKVDKKTFRAEMYGGTWAHFSRAFTLDDVKIILPGSIKISSIRPHDDQINYALEKGLINTVQAQTYRDARSGKIKIAPLEYQCTWVELMTPIYTGTFSEPPPPKNPLVAKIDGATKKPIIDPATKKPIQVEKYSQEEYEKQLQKHKEMMQQGGGSICIQQLGLTINLDPGATGNASRAAGLTKQQALSRTHPYTYLILLEGSAKLGINTVKISSTWRPQIGSQLHKLGDAMDITEIDSDDDELPNFYYKGATVNALAKKFAEFIAGHRYARADKMFYSGDEYNQDISADADHNDHLHFTANRLKPTADEDKLPEQQAKAPTKLEELA